MAPPSLPTPPSGPARTAAEPLPRVELKLYEENILDARICVLSRCRFLEISQQPDNTVVATCGAGVHRAVLPAEKLRDHVKANNDPQPDPDSATNPFLLRLLMAPECCRPECGTTKIIHKRKVLVPDPAESAAPLFEQTGKDSPS